MDAAFLSYLQFVLGFPLGAIAYGGELKAHLSIREIHNVINDFLSTISAAKGEKWG